MNTPLSSPQLSRRDHTMVHFTAECCPPYRKTLCGLDDAGEPTLPDDETCDCIVCHELGQLYLPCPNCGEV